MIRKVWVNDHIEEIEVEEVTEEIEPTPTEPTLEDRVKAAEDAILMLMDMGVM